MTERSNNAPVAAANPLPQIPPPASAADPSWASIVPPPTVKHPLHLLEEFLRSIDAADISANNNTTTTEDQDQYADRLRKGAAKDEARIRSVLRVAEFLYGGTGRTSKTVLDNALEILDSGTGAVRCYRAERSGRHVYVVRGSTYGRGGGGSSNRPSDYLCFLGDLGSESDIGCFCPCRSFYEKCKLDKRSCCKHLLAARLGPYLKLGYEELVISDLQFAHIISRHAFVPS